MKVVRTWDRKHFYLGRGYIWKSHKFHIGNGNFVPVVYKPWSKTWMGRAEKEFEKEGI